MKRILVTGGAGFIGSHLCERLLDYGNEVICLDNFFTGSKINVSHLSERQGFTLMECDITERPDIECEEIYNLACPASPLHYRNNGIITIKTAVIGAINTLELAKTNNARILQASTSEIYGDPQVHPQNESYWGNVNTLGPRSCYDEGKRCAETLFMNYHTEEKVRIKIIRIFNTYGPRMSTNDGRVVSNFIVQALRGDNITIFGDGNITRSFQYVDDLIDGIIRMMQTPDDFIGPVNIGNPEEIKIIDLAKKIIEMTGSSSRIVYLPIFEDDPRRRQPDITLAEKVLGWSPVINLNDGLIKTIDYFKKALTFD
jgi:UDP-glucuronate decarboxylase